MMDNTGIDIPDKKLQRLFEKSKEIYMRNIFYPDNSGLLEIPYPAAAEGGTRYGVGMFYWDHSISTRAMRNLPGCFDLLLRSISSRKNQIDYYGFIPISLGLSQVDQISQVPLFIYEVENVLNMTGDLEWLKGIYPYLKKEYNYWMNPDTSYISKFNNLKTRLKVSNRYNEKIGLNHYDTNDPDDVLVREESMWQGGPYETRGKITAEIWRGRESGWDHSCRWKYGVAKTYPVDLNSVLYYVEVKLSEYAELLGFKDEEAYYYRKAEARKKAINDLMWDERKGFYYDYHIEKGRVTDGEHVGAFWTLWAGLANGSQSALMKKILYDENKFWKKMPLPCCTESFGSTKIGAVQWEYPRVWPPVLVPIIEGFDRYGYYDVVTDICYHILKKMAYGRGGDIPYEQYDCNSGNSTSDAHPALSFAAAFVISSLLNKIVGIDYCGLENKVIINPHIPDEWDKGLEVQETNTVKGILSIRGREDISVTISPFYRWEHPYTRCVVVETNGDYTLEVIMSLPFGRSDLKLDDYALKQLQDGKMVDVTAKTSRVDRNNDGIDEGYKIGCDSPRQVFVITEKV